MLFRCPCKRFQTASAASMERNVDFAVSAVLFQGFLLYSCQSVGSDRRQEVLRQSQGECVCVGGGVVCLLSSLLF